MTLILSVNGKETIWMLADRRLTSNCGPQDDARKIMLLDTKDGTAILGYAGLGKTAHGTEPSDWMSSVLRGRNLPLEHSLKILAEVMTRQLPKHLTLGTRNGFLRHNIVCPAFVGDEVRLYTIDLAVSSDFQRCKFKITRHFNRSKTGLSVGLPRMFAAGTGGHYLCQNRGWVKEFLPIVRASDKGKVTDEFVADYLAKINYKVHQELPDKSVGSRCIVAWRHRKNNNHKGGGAHLFYTETIRDKYSPSLPAISNGMDVGNLCNILFKHMERPMRDSLETGVLEGLYTDELKDEISKLPDQPDENLP